MSRLVICFLLVCCFVSRALCQDENVLFYAVSSDGAARTIVPSSGYVTANPYFSPQPQVLVSPNFVSQLAIDPIGKLGFVPQTLRGATSGSFDPRNFSLAVYNLDANVQAANNALRSIIALPWANTYQPSSSFNVFWEQAAGVVLVANALDASSPYQLWSVAPSTGALTKLFEWPVSDRFQAGAGAYNQSSRQAYFLQTAPGLAIATLDLKTMQNTSAEIGTTTSLKSVTVFGLGFAFNALHAFYSTTDFDGAVTANYGLLNPRTGLLSSIAQLDNATIPASLLGSSSSNSWLVTASEGTNELYLINSSPYVGRLVVVQLFTGAPVRVVDLYNSPGNAFYAAGAISTAPSPSVVRFASQASSQGLSILPLTDGWVLPQQTSITKLAADGSELWNVPFRGFMSPNGVAVANKGQTLFFGSTSTTLNAPSLLTVATVSGTAPPALLNVSTDFTAPNNSVVNYIPPVVSAAADQASAVFINNMGIFPSDCGNFCTGYAAVTISFCSAQLVCSSFFLNNSNVFGQALSGNGEYLFASTYQGLFIYSAFPLPALLTTFTTISISSIAAASYTGNLAVVSYAENLVFLTNDGTGKFSSTVLSTDPWISVSAACSEDTVVVANTATLSAQYNISFYRSSSSGGVPQLVATYSPFPGFSTKNFVSRPITTAITSDGRHALVGGLQNLGSNLWIFDLNTIDAQRGTIAPPVAGFLPGSVLKLSLLDSAGRLGVSTTTGSDLLGNNFVFGFDI